MLFLIYYAIIISMNKKRVNSLKLVAATKNKGKIREIKRMLSLTGIDVISSAEAGIDKDIEETGTTFAENAMIKARGIAEMCKLPVLADDSGLCVEALGGRPGVYSARYAGEGASDGERINKLLSELAGVEDRRAKFVCDMALVMPDGRAFTAEGEVNGHILYEPDGENGFGYDPIFCCDELKKSFAAASDSEKNSVSHRGRALNKICEIIKKEKFFKEV